VATCAVCGYEAAASFKFCPECGARSRHGGREQRKVVTVLFCDVTGSTALGESLDPEALRALLASYFERAKAIIEHHGGTVEKFIGDAVMAVFGVPVAHEDDAVRALRAAAELRDALPQLGIAGRIGVNTGEVVAGTEERLATGDAVNVAARLEQAAQPGEVLVGDATVRLVGEAAELDPVEPLALKGKADPVPAWRLVSLSGSEPERRLDQPLIGRLSELRVLADAWQRARETPGCELVTIVGPAGMGKSRLVAEFLATVESTVVRGRCLSYGEGITYWPVVEVLKQLDPVRAQVMLDPAATDALAALVDREGMSSTEEIAWAFRKLLEAIAAEQPIVVVFDDIQWGEDVFLDLVEHLVFLSTSAPILLVCMARPELLDRRSGWGGVIQLQPLSTEESESLITAEAGSALPDNVRERIVRAGGGNPLFVEEMAALARASANEQIEVPPTIQALLTARLDQLDGSERSVLERGSIEGEIFHRGSVLALSPDEGQLTTRLTALVRKDLLRPDRAQLVGDDAYRFRHLLIRDAAYEGLPKAQRAELHERFANWLAERGPDLVELDEVLGYHLEQSYRYRHELGSTGEHESDLAARSRRHLWTAGRRAMEWNDFTAATNLLERAAALDRDERPNPLFEIELGWARFNVGRADDGLEGIQRARTRARSAGDRVAAAQLALEAGSFEVGTHATAENAGRLRSLAHESIELFEAAESESGLACAYAAMLLAEQTIGESWDRIGQIARKVIEHARPADDRMNEAWAESQLVLAMYHGTTTVEDALHWLDANQHLEQRPAGLPYSPLFLAMLGRFDEAHNLLDATAERMDERGSIRNRTWLTWRRFVVCMLAGDHRAAAQAARESYETALAAGDLSNAELFCCYAAQACVALGEDDAAGEWLARGWEKAPSAEAEPRVLRAQVRSGILTRRGDVEEGERLAREAVASAERTDFLNVRAGAYLDLAHVLALAGGDPRDPLEQGLALYERKGNVVMAERTRARLAGLAR
jgi:class 3 adenylate cyclase/tetratricopeptide (TPR) repeat protein